MFRDGSKRRPRKVPVVFNCIRSAFGSRTGSDVSSLTPDRIDTLCHNSTLSNAVRLATSTRSIFVYTTLNYQTFRTNIRYRQPLPDGKVVVSAYRHRAASSTRSFTCLNQFQILLPVAGFVLPQFSNRCRGRRGATTLLVNLFSSPRMRLASPISIHKVVRTLYPLLCLVFHMPNKGGGG